jgi:hypothetical protein
MALTLSDTGDEKEPDRHRTRNPTLPPDFGMFGVSMLGSKVFGSIRAQP